MAVWMYRKGEARLFASLSDVPAGEGWQDTPPADMHVHDDGAIVFGDDPKPAEPEPEQPAPAPETPAEPQPVAETPAEQAAHDVEPTELDVLRARATELGITVDGRWGIAKIKRMIAEAESPNGDGS